MIPLHSNIMHGATRRGRVFRCDTGRGPVQRKPAGDVSDLLSLLQTADGLRLYARPSGRICSTR